MIEDKPGVFRRAYEVTCGRCGYTDGYYGKLKYAQDQARGDGWRKTRRYGWVCGGCFEGLKGGTTGE